MNFSLRKLRAFFRLFLSRFARAVTPDFLREKLTHSLDRPFGDKYYLDRAKNYDKDRLTQASWHAEYSAMEKVALTIGRQVTVLDVPVGSGRFFPIYEKQDWQVTGLDISADMLRECESRTLNGKNKGEPFLVRGRSDELPFENGSFDVVVCFRFLQSIVDFETARGSLLEFSRVSRNFVVIHIDVAETSSKSASDISPRETMRGKLAWEQIEELLHSSGLKIIQTEGPMPSDGRNEFVVLCSRGDL